MKKKKAMGKVLAVIKTLICIRLIITLLMI